MNYDIRHILLPLLTAIACAAASCSSEPYSGLWRVESKEEIKLELAPGSRTVITNNDNITDQPYMLFGDIRYDESRLDSIFYWQSVKYNGTKWDYGVPQYWFMGHEHSFVAMHPFLSKDDPQVEILEYEDSKLSFTYHLPEKLEEAKDLLFATYRRKYTLDNGGPIQLQFTHLLPRINVSMALIEKDLMYDHVDEDTTYNRNEYIQVYSIEFNSIKTRASFKMTPKPLEALTGNSTNAYTMTYLLKDDQIVETRTVTLDKPCKVPNSYKEGVDDEKQELEYVTALDANEIIVMLPQEFEDSTAQMVVNYSINDDKDLKRRIVIPLKGTVWEEGVFYTYKLLIDDPYYSHIIDTGKITVDIDDFRLHGEDGEEDPVGDDSWITDEEDLGHNIHYGYDSEGNSGPIDVPKE